MGYQFSDRADRHRRMHGQQQHRAVRHSYGCEILERIVRRLPHQRSYPHRTAGHQQTVTVISRFGHDIRGYRLHAASILNDQLLPQPAGKALREDARDKVHGTADLGGYQAYRFIGIFLAGYGARHQRRKSSRECPRNETR